jgi:D-3-phosphoglycerate dehydrogenase
VGLVSYGAIAKALVKLLKPFRVKLLVYDIVPIPEEDKKEYNITQVSLETVFAESDIVSVHTPLNPHTHHLIGKELFSLIKPGALFLNTARGGVLNQAELEDELEKGRFRAFLDVYEQEPPPPDCRLFNLPNVTMMPHMGGPTIDLRQYIARDLLLESAAFIDRGEPLQHEVSREMAAQMSNS